MSRRRSTPDNVFYLKTDPNPPVFDEPWEGDIYFNTVSRKLRIFTEGEWSFIDTPTVSYANLPAGTTLTVYESGGGYTRPTSRTDITVVFVGTVDPAASAVDGVDMWDQI